MIATPAPTIHATPSSAATRISATIAPLGWLLCVLTFAVTEAAAADEDEDEDGGEEVFGVARVLGAELERGGGDDKDDGDDGRNEELDIVLVIDNVGDGFAVETVADGSMPEGRLSVGPLASLLTVISISSISNMPFSITSAPVSFTPWLA